VARHAVAADFIVLDGVAFGDVGPFGAGSQIDAGAQKIGLIRGVVAVERAGVVAVREVQVRKMIAAYRVAGTDDENAAEEKTVDGVVRDADVARLHVRIAVVHDDAEVAVRIAFELVVFVEAGVAADFAVVEAVEVEALAVDFLELIVAVDRPLDVAGRIDRDREMPGLRDPLLRADSRSCGRDCSPRGPRSRGPPEWRRGRSWRIRCRRCARGRCARRCRGSGSRCRCRARRRCGIEDFEIRGAFFEQDAAGRVVALAGVEAAAGGDLDVVDSNGVAGIDEDGETGDSRGLDLAISRLVTPFGEDAVVGVKRENMASDGGRPRAGDGVAVAVEREVVES
jgi:hypothetical protein